MGKLLLKAVTLADGRVVDILISGNLISRIIEKDDEAFGKSRADKTIDCNGKTAIPGFINMHTHSGMTVMRGICEDQHLKNWLDKIWSIESHLDDEIIYWGTKLAILEMFRTGTSCFLDMYWRVPSAVRASQEMGVRAFHTYNFLDNFDPETIKLQQRECAELYEMSKNWPARTRMAVSVHADYTVSDENLVWAKHFADEHGLIYTGHLAETAAETHEDEVKLGLTPARHWDKLGVLDCHTVLAHGVWLTLDEVRMLGNRGVSVVHNVNSNLKLSSGYKFKYSELRNAGVNVCLGTDGTASSNNLDMREAMKTMSMLQKAWREDPTALPLHELMDVATLNGAKALCIDAGRIAEGALADISLVNTRSEAFVPDFNFLGNLVFSANSSCFDTLIIDGKVVMEGRKVAGEDEILENANRLSWKLYKMS